MAISTRDVGEAKLPGLNSVVAAISYKWHNVSFKRTSKWLPKRWSRWL